MEKVIVDIIDIAKSYVGFKEIPGNMGWTDSKFESLMESCGWSRTQAWCSYFVELVWKLAYKDNQVITLKLDSLFNAGALKTYDNFLHDKTFRVDKHCTPGAIVIWQYYVDKKPTWKGHAGIVTSEVSEHQFHTVEGNTNAQGGREGIEVAEKIRLLNFDSRNGLVLRGFLHPIEIRNES